LVGFEGLKPFLKGLHHLEEGCVALQKFCPGGIHLAVQALDSGDGHAAGVHRADVRLMFTKAEGGVEVLSGRAQMTRAILIRDKVPGAQRKRGNRGGKKAARAMAVNSNQMKKYSLLP